MAYDAEKDTILRDLGEIPGTDMIADVRCYADGVPKIAISRVIGKSGRTVKVVRLPLDEAKIVGQFLLTALGILENEPLDDDDEEEAATE